MYKKMVSLVVLSLMAQQASAINIIGNFISQGNTFPGTAYVAQPYASLGAPAGTNPDAVFQQDFNAAATYWAQRFDDPFTLKVNYGFSTAASGASGVEQNLQVDSTGRVTEANIYYNPAFGTGGDNDPWYVDPTPFSNDGFQRTANYFANLGGGVISTGQTFAAIPGIEPPSCASYCGPGGANHDVLTNGLHELAHALNMNSSTLSRLDPNNSGNIVIPNGPFAGTTIPWDTGGGGHPRLDPPTGVLVTDGNFHGEHRKLISEADALIIASVENFKRVNLDDRSYVALPNFADTSILTLNGNAQTADVGSPQQTVLRLTPDVPGQSGSAFLTLPYTITDHTIIASHFEFNIGGVNGGGPQGSDGLAFVLQQQGPKATGNGGEGMGFGTNQFSPGTPSIAPSIAIAFDTHQNSFDHGDNQIEFVLNGDVQHPLHYATAPFSLNGEGPVFVWVDYTPLAGSWDVFLSHDATRPDSPSLSYVFNIDNWAAGKPLYFGFTGGTGSGFNTHDILNWQLALSPVPEPHPLNLMCMGLAWLFFAGRRKLNQGA